MMGVLFLLTLSCRNRTWRRLLSALPSQIMSQEKINTITVYCASSNSVDGHFQSCAEDLGRHMAERNLQLVYGGGSVGLMGVIARTLQQNGGKVTGVITRRLVSAEQLYDKCDETIIVDSMRERKAIMAQRGDAVIVLPGGVGTLEEFFEILVGRLVGEHEMPIAVVNVEGYFDPLLNMLDHVVEEGFAKPAIRKLFLVTDNPVEAVEAMLQGRGEMTPDDSMLPSGSAEISS
ncbi:MAG TPA: TIGR00730 family Rossman fold protein [Phycisphaeraceae bacterium]|nr:TIGR00730 family Rossman fold protein [Phycisphaeraceae bacterium]